MGLDELQSGFLVERDLNDLDIPFSLVQHRFGHRLTTFA